MRGNPPPEAKPPDAEDAAGLGLGLLDLPILMEKVCPSFREKSGGGPEEALEAALSPVPAATAFLRLFDMGRLQREL